MHDSGTRRERGRAALSGERDPDDRCGAVGRPAGGPHGLATPAGRVRRTPSPHLSRDRGGVLTGLTIALVAVLQAVQAAAGPGWQALVPSIVGPDDVARSVRRPAVADLPRRRRRAGPRRLAGRHAWHLGGPAARRGSASRCSPSAALAVRTRRGRERTGRTPPSPGRSTDSVWSAPTSCSGRSHRAGRVRHRRRVDQRRRGLPRPRRARRLADPCSVLWEQRSPWVPRGRAARRTGPPVPRRSMPLLLAFLVTSLMMVAPVWSPSCSRGRWSGRVVGVAVGALQALCGALLAERAPAESRGQVFATAAASTRAASLVATALGGAVGTVLGAQGVFLVAGCGCLCATVLPVGRLRNAVRRPDAVSRDRTTRCTQRLTQVSRSGGGRGRRRRRHSEGGRGRRPRGVRPPAPQRAAGPAARCSSRPSGSHGPGADQQPSRVIRVRLARGLRHRELTGGSGPAEHDHGPVLAPGRVLLEGHPRPHDLAGVGMPVVLRGVGEAHRPGVHPRPSRLRRHRHLTGLPPPPGQPLTQATDDPGHGPRA